MRKILTISIIAALLCGIGLASIVLAATPQAGNNSQERPQFNQWVEPRDMSEYSNYNPPNVTKTVFNESWVQTRPGGVILDPSKIDWKEIRVVQDESQFQPTNSTRQITLSR